MKIRKERSVLPGTDPCFPGQQILEDFAKSVASLEASQQRIILPWLHSLRSERNPDFLLAGLMQVGVHLKSAGHELAALTLFTRLSQNDIPEEIRVQARKERSAFEGDGPSGMRAEYLLAEFGRPEDCFRKIVPWLGTAMAGRVIGTVMSGVLGRAAWGGWAGFLTRGWGKSLSAGVLTLAAEIPILAGLTQALVSNWEGSASGTDSVFNLFYMLMGDRLGRGFLGWNRLQAEWGARMHHGSKVAREILNAGKPVSVAALEARAILPRSTAMKNKFLWRMSDGSTPSLSGNELSRISLPSPTQAAGKKAGEDIGPNDRYVIERPIGSGGMAEIYQARDKNLDRIVALKISRQTMAKPDSAARLRKEAEAMGILSGKYHPIVYDIFSLPTGQVAMVMEFIEGHTLRQVIQKIQDGDWVPHFPLERRLDLLVQLCRGVELAHDAGIIHRDLKPANVMWRGALDVPSLDQICVLDYGLMKQAVGAVPPAGSPDSKRGGVLSDEELLSEDGATVGTPGYISPELLYLDAFPFKYSYFGDVFALGVISFELITGILPTAHFQKLAKGAGILIPERNPTGGIVVDKYYKQYLKPKRAYPQSSLPRMLDVIPPDRYDSRLIPMSEIVSKALAFNPTARHPSVAAYRRDLETVIKAISLIPG